MRQVDWQRRRDMLISIICVGIIVWTLWNLMNQFIEAILLFLLAMAIAFLITPIVDRLEQLHIPRLLSTFLAYVLVLALMSAFTYAIISSLVEQITGFSNTVITYTNAIPQHYSAFIQFLHIQAKIPQQRITDTIDNINLQVAEFANAAINNTINIIFLLTNTLLDALITLVISFYLTLDGKRIRKSIISVVPRRSISQVLLFENALTRVVGNYIRGQIALAFIVGLLVTLVCTFTGLSQFAIIFGILGFLFETIPMLGPMLASLSPVLTSLLLPDPFPRTLIVIVCFIAIQLIESNIIAPRIVGQAVGFHPVASIMALLVFATLFGNAFGPFGGAVGALIATPLAATLWIVLAGMYSSLRGENPGQPLAQKPAPWSLRHLLLHRHRSNTITTQQQPTTPFSQEQLVEQEHTEEQTITSKQHSFSISKKDGN